MRIAEVKVTHEDGDERVYRLKIHMGPSCELQKRTKQTIGQLLDRAAGLDFEAVSQLAFLFLQAYHSDEVKSDADARAWLDRAGGPHVFFEALEKLSPWRNEPKPAPPAEPTSAAAAA